MLELAVKVRFVQLTSLVFHSVLWVMKEDRLDITAFTRPNVSALYQLRVCLALTNSKFFDVFHFAFSPVDISL